MCPWRISSRGGRLRDLTASSFAAGATTKFHKLPEHARDALVARLADLVERPWDDGRVLPGDEQALRGAAFDDGRGMLEFHVDAAAEIIRIFDTVWLGAVS